MSRILAVTTDLISLERGADELLLADGGNLNPLYALRGRDYIQRYVDAIRSMPDADAISAARMVLFMLCS